MCTNISTLLQVKNVTYYYIYHIWYINVKFISFYNLQQILLILLVSDLDHLFLESTIFRIKYFLIILMYNSLYQCIDNYLLDNYIILFVIIIPHNSDLDINQYRLQDWNLSKNNKYL